MPDQASLDSTISMLRSNNWGDPALNKFANQLAVSLSGVARQQTFNRGLHDGSLVDANGGTIIKVGDRSIGNPSASLQVPQRGFLIKHGAVATRRQARVDVESRTVPAIVTDVQGTQENATLTVRVSGDTPVLSTSETTKQLTLGGVLNQLTSSGGTEYSISMAGTPFADSEDPAATGPELPTVGQTINVNISTQNKKTTIWTKRSNRNYPRVTNIADSTAATTVNGICCKQDTSGGGGGGGGGT